MTTVSRISVSTKTSDTTAVHITRGSDPINFRIYRNITEASADRLEKILFWHNQFSAWFQNTHIFSDGIIMVWRKERGND